MSRLPKLTRPLKTGFLGTAAFAAAFALSGCQDGQMPGFLQAKDKSAAADASGPSAISSTERDVEAPDAFQASENGLWDGRPSLGGVWAAHPDVKSPERVIIRNETNGKFVVGALFRKERETPGPRIQISSDAAAALGMLAGQPTKLNVVALRRETVKDTVPPEAPTPNATGALDAPSDIEASEIDDLGASTTVVLSQTQAAPKPASTSSLAKPFVQIGIFSVEKNANNTAVAMRQAGMVPTVKKQSSSGKTFWRVLVGPAQSTSELNTLLKKSKAQGFTDAYAVSN